MSESAEIRDPVCGKLVDPLRARAVGIFSGVTHYFCSPECKAGFVDPREVVAAAPGGVERRWQDEPGAGASGEWFETGQVAPPAAKVERFQDLDRAAAPIAEAPPSPSLMLEVEASRRGTRTWIWVVVIALIGGTLLALGLGR